MDAASQKIGMCVDGSPWPGCTISTNAPWPSRVRIREGYCGAGFIFTISSIFKTEQGVQVYGNDDSYGPVDACTVEAIGSRTR